jgi:hypothetical protein
MPSEELFVSKFLTIASRKTNAVFAIFGADPVQDQEPPPQDPQTVVADAFNSSQSLQQWEVTTLDVLHARLQVQGSRATAAPIRQELDSSPTQVIDRPTFKQMSSEDVQHFVAPSPSVSQGTKRRRELEPEPEPEPPTSKHDREHETSKQPQQSTSQTCQHCYQSKLAQESVDDLGVVRSIYKPASTQENAQLAEASEPNGAAFPAPLATPPKTSASTTLAIPPIVLGKSTLIPDQLRFLPDGAFFLHLSRVKCALEDTINSDEGVPWVTRFPEAPRMISKINDVLEGMSYCVKRSELDFGAREWMIWYDLDRTVERRRMDELKGKGKHGTKDFRAART